MCGFSDYCNSGCCFTTELHNCSLHNCCQRHFLSTVEPVIYIFYYVTTPVLAVQDNMKQKHTCPCKEAHVYLSFVHFLVQIFMIIRICINSHFLYQRTFDQANWIEENIFTLCDISCEEARDGNCPNGVWTTRGYQNLKTKFFQRARLRHSSKQIKNKMNQLKKWYVAWVWLGTKTGKGIATQLFAEPHNRIMFMNMKSKEARLVWLKRWCQQKNLMQLRITRR